MSQSQLTRIASFFWGLAEDSVYNLQIRGKCWDLWGFASRIGAILPSVALQFFLMTTSAAADQHPNLERGFDPSSAYQIGDLDQVNLFNGNLSVTIPIGQTYEGNGNLRYGFTLVYNSKIWDWSSQPTSNGDLSKATADVKSSAGLGWRFSLGELYAPNSAPYNDSQRWVYTGPDGGEHSFYKSLLGPGELCSPGTCYTRDGSYLRLKTGLAGARIVELPDGNQHTFEPFGSTPGRYRLREIRDVYGNKLTIDYSTAEQWNLAETAASVRSSGVTRFC